MTEPQLDEILSSLERTIAKLADGTSPLEDLVVAHQQALKLLAEAQSRLAELKSRADETAKWM